MARTEAHEHVEAPADGAPVFLNRELSRLDFYERVLALAADDTQPLLERITYLAFFGRFLDEFFQIRVSGLREQAAAGLATTSPDGLGPREQLDAIRARVEELSTRAARIFSAELREKLGSGGVRIVDWEELKPAHREELREVFENRIFPVLTPLAVDPAHPFPYISNLSLNLAVIARDPLTREPRFARVKVPPLLPRFLKVSGGRRFVPIEQVIAAHLDLLFPGMKIEAFHVFRVTRDADIEIEVDEAEDLLSALQTELLRRRRTPEAVRLEVNPTMPKELRSLLQRELDLKSQDVYVEDGLLDLGDLRALTDLRRPSLKAKPWIGVTQPRLSALKGTRPNIFEVLRAGDVLVHHPYDSFSTSVEEFVRQAADDRDVLAIKQTLYRTSDEESPIVQALVQAAETGKQVVALVELQARGDEEANIGWAGKLEQAGVHVVYGVVGLKTHAKTVLVVRAEGGQIRRYCHVGTGNYNPVTARVYEDVGLISCDPELTADVADLFNYLTGYSHQRSYRKVLVAPGTLRKRLLDLIREEADAGPGGRIVIKVNNLIDPAIIEGLYQASQAGVEIDLIVRSMCCLQPGVKGLSETIRVRSIVGRYLEHSRIFRFGSDGQARYYIGSADLMQRNLDRRVECVAPVTDPELAARLEAILGVGLADDALAWELGLSGWHKVPAVTGIDSQIRLEELALERSRVEL
ncbi:MAG TPA: polyphosphate kinase 1 [Gaiellaceae bacterium]|nr:polyphosphate kinase 1 [Gaiellaceae bacterium]